MVIFTVLLKENEGGKEQNQGILQTSASQPPSPFLILLKNTLTLNLPS